MRQEVRNTETLTHLPQARVDQKHEARQNIKILSEYK
jgi:hypothetical protein